MEAGLIESTCTHTRARVASSNGSELQQMCRERYLRRNVLKMVNFPLLIVHSIEMGPGRTDLYALNTLVKTNSTTFIHSINYTPLMQLKHLTNYSRQA